MLSSDETLFQKTFILDVSDRELGNEGEPTKITVSQATEEQREVRRRVLEIARLTWDMKLPPDIGSVGPSSVKFAEVFMTLKACNLSTEDINGERPLFDFPLSDFIEFRRSFLYLPPILADEIHSKVLELNPWWTHDVWDRDWCLKNFGIVLMNHNRI